MWVRIPPPARTGSVTGREGPRARPPPPCWWTSTRSTATSPRWPARWPGTTLRPHVKAFKTTALAARLAEAGHTGFCCATVREMVGMAAAGLGDDLLLANESLDLSRLTPDRRGRAPPGSPWPSTPSATIDAAVAAGIREVLVDVDVGHAPLRLRSGRRRSPGRPGPLEGPRGARRDGLRGPPHARARRHQGGPGRGVDGAAPAAPTPRSAATSCPAAAPAPGTSTHGSPSSRPARTA